MEMEILKICFILLLKLTVMINYNHFEDFYYNSL